MSENANADAPRLQAYAGLLALVKGRVRAAQYAALRVVNTELVGLYWDIGRMIVDRQQEGGWGKSVVERLAVDLQQEFPGIRGFSVQNLWYMRQFYLEYHAYERLQPLVGEIAWSHNLAIMSKCKDPLQREFYIRMAHKFGWSKNVLIHQIENQSYEKSLLGQTNFDQALTPELRNQAKLAVKELAHHAPRSVVFRDNGFVADAVKLNVEQIFKQLSPITEARVI